VRGCGAGIKNEFEFELNSNSISRTTRPPLRLRVRDCDEKNEFEFELHFPHREGARAGAAMKKRVRIRTPFFAPRGSASGSGSGAMGDVRSHRAVSVPPSFAPRETQIPGFFSLFWRFGVLAVNAGSRSARQLSRLRGAVRYRERPLRLQAEPRVARSGLAACEGELFDDGVVQEAIRGDDAAIVV